VNLANIPHDERIVGTCELVNWRRGIVDQVPARAQWLFLEFVLN
jgi:hypothetical protein